MAPFYGWGSTISRIQSLYEEKVNFTTQFPGVSGTHLIDLGRTKGWTLEPSSGLEHGTPRLGIQIWS